MTPDPANPVWDVWDYSVVFEHYAIGSDQTVYMGRPLWFRVIGSTADSFTGGMLFSSLADNTGSYEVRETIQIPYQKTQVFVNHLIDKRTGHNTIAFRLNGTIISTFQRDLDLEIVETHTLTIVEKP